MRSRNRLGLEILDVLFVHSRQLENYSDDLIWRLDWIGSYTDDILKLVDDYGEAFTRQIGADDLSRLGRLVNEGLADDVVDAVIRHADHFADYSDDAIKKIAESGCNAEGILTQIDNYAKDFTEDLTAGQLKRLDDILEQGVTPEQFEVLIKHGKQLENYTDEIVGLWRNYSGNGDDFLKLVDEFGDEFVEAFQKNGDEAVEGFRNVLDSGKYLHIRVEEVIPPGSPHPVSVYTDGYAQINTGKINQYIRGKVEADVDALNARIEELVNIEKDNPNTFTEEMRAELKRCRDIVHNYERSQEMNITLNNAGIADTVENNRMIADNLLEAVRQVEPGNTKVISYIEGINGIVQVESWWNITPDGKPYLTTVILKPVK